MHQQLENLRNSLERFKTSNAIRGLTNFRVELNQTGALSLSRSVPSFVRSHVTYEI